MVERSKTIRYAVVEDPGVPFKVGPWGNVSEAVIDVSLRGTEVGTEIHLLKDEDFLEYLENANLPLGPLNVEFVEKGRNVVVNPKTYPWTVSLLLENLTAAQVRNFSCQMVHQRETILWGKKIKGIGKPHTLSILTWSQDRRRYRGESYLPHTLDPFRYLEFTIEL